LRHSKANWREASSGLLLSAGAVPFSTDFFGGIMIEEDVVWNWSWFLSSE
jgi:hypothetical protein